MINGRHGSYYLPAADQSILQITLGVRVKDENIDNFKIIYLSSGYYWYK